MRQQTNINHPARMRPQKDTTHRNRIVTVNNVVVLLLNQLQVSSAKLAILHSSDTHIDMTYTLRHSSRQATRTCICWIVEGREKF